MRTWTDGLGENVSELALRRNILSTINTAGDTIAQLISVAEDMLRELEMGRIMSQVKGSTAIKVECQRSGRGVEAESDWWRLSR